MGGFKDHFSGHAADYARFRPSYPEALFGWLAEVSPGAGDAWDAGTGNGQVAVALAKHFERVVATDASAEQIASAFPHPSVSYRAARAEDSGLPDASVDLVTVGQALHWFDLDAFWPEVGRALRPGGVVAVWSYALIRVSEPVDAVLARFYGEVVGPYWPPERALVEKGYGDVPFPFEPVPTPPFAMEADWDLAALRGYLGTWSATRRYLAAHGRDPLDHVADALRNAWGPADVVRRIAWPLSLRVGRT